MFKVLKVWEYLSQSKATRIVYCLVVRGVTKVQKSNTYSPTYNIPQLPGPQKRTSSKKFQSRVLSQIESKNKCLLLSCMQSNDIGRSSYIKGMRWGWVLNLMMWPPIGGGEIKTFNPHPTTTRTLRPFKVPRNLNRGYLVKLKVKKGGGGLLLTYTQRNGRSFYIEGPGWGWFLGLMKGWAGNEDSCQVIIQGLGQRQESTRQGTALMPAI